MAISPETAKVSRIVVVAHEHWDHLHDDGAQDIPSHLRESRESGLGRTGI